MKSTMRDIRTVLRTNRSAGPFSFFTDEALAALAPAIDAFTDDVLARREPQTSLVHDYNCEVGHRKNQRVLAERRARRAAGQ